MTPEPVYFGPEGRPLFGWLHPAARRSKVALVVCNPFGYEAVCAHRSLRHFCQAAAAAGVAALRFDYDGTGDSAGHDREPGRLAAWVRSVHDAVELVRQRAGAERIVLLGVRLGALVATLAAVERDDVAGLIAVAPVVAGRAHLRELKALQMAALRPPTPAGVVAEDGVQEALGFVLTEASRQAIAAVDLTRLPRPPAPSVLLLERDDLPGNDAWPERLAAQGVAVERARLPGYPEMMLGPQDARVPEAMVAAARAFLGRLAGAGAAGPALAPEAAPAAQARVPLEDAPDRFVVERAERIGAERRLFGVLTRPDGAAPGRRLGLLLLNAGSVHHIGSNRLYVTLARRWAALGHVVLRLDLSGIGDSPPRPGDPENVVYTDHATQDVATALDHLRRQPGVSAVHALGLCSGGYNAFKAAVAGVPLDGVVLINPLTFFYKPGMSLDVQPHEVTSEAARYTRSLASLDKWKKLLRGQVKVDAALRVIARRAAMLARDRLRTVARVAGVKLGDDLVMELRAVVGREIALRFIFSAGDPGVSLLREQAGADADRLRREGRLAIDVIDGADHTFTPLWSQPLLVERLTAHLDAGPPGSRA